MVWIFVTKEEQEKLCILVVGYNLLAHGNASWVLLISAKSESRIISYKDNDCIIHTLYHSGIIIDAFKLSNYVKLV